MNEIRVNNLASPAFWEVVTKRQQNGERYGQAVFNTACVLFPEECGKLNGTELDPFYNDRAVKSFLEALTNLLTDR
jgi:hypothetical protein